MSWQQTTIQAGQASDITMPEHESASIENIQRTRSWLMTYIALVTSLLAFFIFIITFIEIEGSPLKRDYQKLTNALYWDLQRAANHQALDWLQIENTLTKGVRISLPPDLIGNQNLFASARAQINPRFLPYLQNMAEVLRQLDIETVRQRYPKWVKSIEASGYDLKIMIRVEGHTDASAMAATGRFRNNVELSTFRAYAMMDWLRIHLPLAREYFVIAGYGSFHPLVKNPMAAENRRIEIYIQPQLRAALQKAEDDK